MSFIRAVLLCGVVLSGSISAISSMDFDLERERGALVPLGAGGVVSLVPQFRDPQSGAVSVLTDLTRSALTGRGDDAAASALRAFGEGVSMLNMIAENAKVTADAIEGIPSLVDCAGARGRTSVHPVFEFLGSSLLEVGISENNVEILDLPAWVRGLSTNAGNGVYVRVSDYADKHLADNVYVDIAPNNVHTVGCARLGSAVQHKGSDSCCSQYVEWVRTCLMHIGVRASQHNRAHENYVRGVGMWNAKMSMLYDRYVQLGRKHPGLREQRYPSMEEPVEAYRNFVFRDWLVGLSPLNSADEIKTLTDREESHYLATRVHVASEIGEAGCTHVGSHRGGSSCCGGHVRAVKRHMFNVAKQLAKNQEAHILYVTSAKTFESRVLSVMNGCFQTLRGWNVDVVSATLYERAHAAVVAAKRTLGRVSTDCSQVASSIGRHRGALDAVVDKQAASRGDLATVGLAVGFEHHMVIKEKTEIAAMRDRLQVSLDQKEAALMEMRAEVQRLTDTIRDIRAERGIDERVGAVELRMTERESARGRQEHAAQIKSLSDQIEQQHQKIAKFFGKALFKSKGRMNPADRRYYMKGGLSLDEILEEAEELFDFPVTAAVASSVPLPPPPAPDTTAKGKV